MKKSIKNFIVTIAVAAGTLAFHPTFAMENLDSDTINLIMNALNMENQNNSNNHPSFMIFGFYDDNELSDNLQNLNIEEQTSTKTNSAQKDPILFPTSNSTEKNESINSPFLEETQKLSNLCDKLLKKLKSLQDIISDNKKSLAEDTDFISENAKDTEKVENLIKDVELEKMNIYKNINDLNDIKIKIKNFIIETIKLESSKNYNAYCVLAKNIFENMQNIDLTSVIYLINYDFKTLLNELKNLIKSQKSDTNKHNLQKIIDLNNKINNNYKDSFFKQTSEMKKLFKKEQLTDCQNIMKSLLSEISNFTIKLIDLLFNLDLIEQINFTL